MPRLQIKVDNKELKLFDGFSYTTQIDGSAAGVSFSSFVDFETFGYSKVQVFRNDVLIFTGEIINKTIPIEVPKKPFVYKAETLTHELFECTIPTEAYPLQIGNSTLKDIVEFICSYFDVEVVFDQSAEEEAGSEYKLADLELGKEAGKIINDLVTQQALVMSHNADGNLVITKAIEQDEIILPRYTSDNKSFDLKKLFNKYIALGQAPIGEDSDIQSIATFENIKTTRNTTKIQDSGGIDTIEKKAIGMRADSLKAIQHNLSFNNFFCNVGDYVVMNDYKLIINQLNYSFDANGEKASIGLIDSNIYNR